MKTLALLLCCLLAQSPALLAQQVIIGGTTIDAERIGVDCSYTNDSAPALNALTDNENGFGGPLSGATLVFPPGCHVKLVASNWRVVNQGPFTIAGASRGTAPYAGVATTISYCGNDPTVATIDMESVSGGEMYGLAIESRGTGCPVGALKSLVVDKANAHSNVNTTDIFLHDLTLTTNQAGGSGPDGWSGLSLSPLQGSNVEDIRLWNSRIHCQGSPHSSGVNLNWSFNVKLEEFKHNQIGGCTCGYTQGGGQISLEGGDLAGNSSDVCLGVGSDPSLFTNIISESDQAFLGVPNNWPDTLVADHAGWGPGSSGKCGFDFGNLGTAGAGLYTIIGSGADTPPPGAIPWCASTNQNITEINDQWNGWNILNTFLAGKDIGKSYGSIFGGMFRTTNAAHVPSDVNESIGYGFIAHNGMDLPTFTFNANSNQQCAAAGRPCVGQDVAYLGNEAIVLSGVWPIPQYLEYCLYTGTPGTVHWATQILPIDANGNRAGIYPPNGNWGCFNAASTLDTSDFLTVYWPRVSGAVNYAIILMSPNNNSAGELIATVPDQGFGLLQSTIITSGSTSDTFNYNWPQYYEAAQTTINGSLTINATTTFSAGGSPNRAVCWKPDGKSLGFCLTQPDSAGSCICN